MSKVFVTWENAGKKKKKRQKEVLFDVLSLTQIQRTKSIFQARWTGGTVA